MLTNKCLKGTALRNQLVHDFVSQVFSSGHNLKEMTVETGYDYHKKIFDTCEAMMRLVGQVNIQFFWLHGFEYYQKAHE